MRTQIDDNVRQRSQRLADLQNEAAELERRLSDTRVLLKGELDGSGRDSAAIPEQIRVSQHARPMPAELDFEANFGEPDEAYELGPDADEAAGYDSAYYGRALPSAEARTEVLVTHGRGGRHYRNISRRQLIAAAAAGLALVTILVVILAGGGASWPSSVALTWRVVLCSRRAPSRASSPFTASVTDERGRPRSSAARLKLRRSRTRVKTRMASRRSICS